MATKIISGLCAAVGFCGILAFWWYVHPEPEEHLPLETLRAIVSDPGQSQEAHRKAIIAIFKDYVPPNASATTVRQVFGDCEWIDEVRISQIEATSGEPPVLPAKLGGTFFVLHFLTPDGENSEWSIWLLFSGAYRSPEGVKRFFSPKAAPDSWQRLAEFAIRDYRTNKWEVFDATGRHPPR
jgi:hypothetical protein